MIYKQNKYLLDKEWLRDQYEVKQKSMRTIADELGVTTPIVSKYVKRYGFVLRSAGESKTLTAKIRGPKSRNVTARDKLADKEWLYKKYVVEGLSTRDIATLTGLKSRRTIKSTLIKHQIPIRDLKEARNLRTAKGPEFRKTVPSLLNDIDFLIDEYVNKHKSIQEIKNQIGCSGKSIRRRLMRAGILLRNCNESNIGKKHSLETIKKMSATASKQIMDGTRSSHGNGNRMTCLTPNGGFVVMRSSWEKRYAEYLKSNNIDFKYEHKSFPLSNGKSYIADFYLPTTDEYVEIKGYLSQNQSDKYELFRQEYPNIKWKIVHREGLIDLGVSLKKDIPTVYLLVGAPGAGKSWVASQLLDSVTYVSYDNNAKSDHLDLLRAPSDKPKLYDPTFKISTIIKRHSQDFNFIMIAIQEEETVLKSRIESRGGAWTNTIMKRNNQIRQRYEKYGAGGFIGTSQEVLDYMKAEILNNQPQEIEPIE